MMRSWFEKQSVVHQLALLILFITILLLGSLTAYVTTRTSVGFLQQEQHALARETGLIAKQLSFFHHRLTSETDRLGKLFLEMFPGGIRVDELRQIEVANRRLPLLVNQDQPLALDFSKPDRFTHLTGGVATLFQRLDDDFLRISTSLKKQDGSRAVGTLLDHDHPAYPQLLSGQVYIGPAQLYGRQYMTQYTPFKDKAGKVIGILFVGLDYTEQLAAILHNVDELVFGETGYAFIMTSAQDKVRGRLVLHPTAQGRSVFDILDEQAAERFELVFSESSGVVRYPLKDSDSGRVRDKLTAFQHVPEWNWIVATSGYTNEFTRHAVSLRNEMILLSALTGILLAGLAFFALRRQLRPLKDVGDSMEALGQGDLRVHLTAENASAEGTRNELSLLAHRVSRMAAQLRDLIADIMDSATSLSSSTDQISAVSSQTSRGVRQQQTDIDSVAAAINQMTATTQDVARNAAAAATESQKADSQAAEGGARVNDVVTSINALANEVEHSAGIMEKVENESESIGQVIEVITGVADQTNLLALNAAIEAAHAGEQGRGFTVVADEVRQLAQKTRYSTTEIREMIERLQRSTKQAAMAMRSGRERTRATVEDAAHAGHILSEITRSVSTINSMATQIAVAAEQQSVVAEDINQRVVSIGDVANQNAGGVDEMARAMQELQAIAIRLKDAVANFRVN